MKTWLRPLPFALLFGYGLVRLSHAPMDDNAPNRSAALCSALAHEGITCTADDVTWVDGSNGVLGALGSGGGRALVRGRVHTEQTAAAEASPEAKAAAEAAGSDALDLYDVTARLSPEGSVLELTGLYNLTKSADADEGTPVIQGSRVAYVVSVDGRPEAIHVLDFAGHDPHAYDELSRFQRWQLSISDWQATGRKRGVKRTVFALVPAPARAELSFRADGMVEVKTDANRAIVLDPSHDSIVEGAAYARASAEVVAKPPTFGPWMSDRLRAISWFGDEKNQTLKAIVFTAQEWIKNAKAKVTGDTSEKDVAEDIGSLTGKPVAATFTDPEIGWPPKPLEPVMKPALPGEGQWISLDKDAFITPIPGVPSPFLTTFVRTDPAAQYTRVYITLWDPRLVALHMEAGTVEPVSATGEAGTGRIPRTPEVMRHVVAGFNGGFQATHGEYGMQADGVLYLPPKPYAATVMELRDGTTGFGAWPRATEVPEDVLSFRQNMTALVQNDKYNPWGRTWWGGVPPGWHDAIHTTRSGLCITKENFVAYFWGNDIGPEPLGKAMLAARCAFGMHLDMNPGLAGFEFYNMQPAATFQPLGRPLQSDWEYEGALKDMPEFKFRSRRMVKSMGHILFPRYIHRDGRDFFYLTTRSVLPGPPIGGESGGGSNGEGEGGVWRVKGLPQHGYPYAIATTSVRLGPEGSDKRARVLKVDPRAVRFDSAPAAASSGDAGADASQVVVAFGHAAAHARSPKGATSAAPGAETFHAGASDRKLYVGPNDFSIDKAPPAGAVPIVDLFAANAPASAEARGAVGISDEDGMLVWIELLPETKADASTAEAMSKLLERLGCSSRALVAGSVHAFLGGALDIGGEPVAISQLTARLVRTPAPAARMMFNPTETVPASVWAPLQQQRVKWRPTLAPPEKPAEKPGGSASASSSAPPPPRK